MSATNVYPAVVHEIVHCQDESDATRVVLERTPMTLQEYLQSSYHPDRDYADGCAEERNVGEYEHGKLGFRFANLLQDSAKKWDIDVVPECRLQVTPERFRVPDILVLRAGTPARPYPKTAPLICIEILSPGDSFTRVQIRLNDYLRMGVAHVWVIHPDLREGYIYSESGYEVVEEFTIEGTSIRVTLADVFSVLD